MEQSTTQPSVLAGLLLATSALAAPTLKIPAYEVSVDKSNKHTENNLTPVDKTNNDGSARSGSFAQNIKSKRGGRTGL
ncbi:hypothetical protein P875_00033812 [Aspergillus parasiticus SU-1]|uniref:Uncharacterized protein n=1 Tax=Aspergillus parasiticus (strain ATCC 56775 / NRRL 5862 / SRRC 143 / SU-1) TaxID=1403190 RepID=A0A0F0I6I2_ASPPU|nr:hypothetical protein P875_00033812 [Aspergillus parasiticus SU-1]